MGHHSSVKDFLEDSNVSEAEYGSADWVAEQRERPVRDLLRMAVLTGGGRRLRVIVEKLLEKAEHGDLPAIREVMDRLDRKPVQAIERSDTQPVRLLSDGELLEIIQRGLSELVDEPSYPMIGVIWGPNVSLSQIVESVQSFA